MSHYAMVVFSNDPDDRAFDNLLYPYGEESNDYIEFHPLSDEGLEKKKLAFKNAPYNDFESFMKDCGYKNVNGVWGSPYNDNARWDWYTLDGREFLFNEKAGEKSDERAGGRFRKSQIDFSKYGDEADAMSVKSAKREWNKIMKSDDEEYKKYFINRYQSIDKYVKEMITPCPYCFITPDGKCHAPGFVGWFATDNSTSESMDKYIDEWLAYINSEDDDPYVSIVDCHI